MTSRPRLPQLTDFPTSYPLSIIPPRNNTCSSVTNTLILLHGLGDTELPFKHLAESMALPSTVGISLRAPHQIPPFIMGSDSPAFHWSDDLLFDEQGGDMDGDGGFVRAISWLEEIITVLLNRCDFLKRDIWLFGFGQGAMVVLGLVTKMEKQGEARSNEFGGVVAVGAGLPKEALSWKPAVAEARLKTPVLLCGGSSGTQVTKTVIACINDRFANVRYVKWEKQGDSMPRNREEMLPIMEFFACRMKTRAGVPDDAIEL